MAAQRGTPHKGTAMCAQALLLTECGWLEIAVLVVVVQMSLSGTGDKASSGGQMTASGAKPQCGATT